MPNPENLRPVPFTSENQPAGRGRPKGSKNRSTILKKWLSTKVSLKNPLTGESASLSAEDAVILALIAKARKQDVAAIREILDTVYGKLSTNITVSPKEADSILDDQRAPLPETFSDLDSDKVN